MPHTQAESRFCLFHACAERHLPQSKRLSHLMYGLLNPAVLGWVALVSGSDGERHGRVADRPR
eukprot:1625216-Pleurochrysis_carterae.AAC.4